MSVCTNKCWYGQPSVAKSLTLGFSGMLFKQDLSSLKITCIEFVPILISFDNIGFFSSHSDA